VQPIAIVKKAMDKYFLMILFLYDNLFAGS
jgi:hypothetical protein